MNDLELYFRNNKDRLIFKWHHYFDVYEKHFAKFRNKEVVILEIGVSQGGSLQMWKNYFGKDAKIYGIDINPECKSLEEENVEIFIGSQTDRAFLKKVLAQIPPVDILIDDGGHTMKQQIVSFEELFFGIKPDGVYLCEDCHSSYWREWGGGYKRKGTFIEYAKNWIDSINAFHSKEKRLKVSAFTRSARSLHFYDSIVVIEKAVIEQPVVSQTGVESFSTSYMDLKSNKIIKRSKKYLNMVGAFFKLPHVE